jgi:alpha-glucosidase
MRVLAATDQVLAFERTRGGDHIVCVFNLSNSDASFDGDSVAGERLLTVGAAQDAGQALKLEPRSAVIARRKG